MSSFVHLHTHTQYSLLDGQASVKKLVDKAIKDGMPGIAITDHGNMFAIKEFMNYVGKVNGAKAGREKDLKKLLDKMLNLQSEHSNLATYLAQLKDDESALKAEIAAEEKRHKGYEPSEEQAKQLASLAGDIATLEEMQKEFGFDAVKAREIIVESESIAPFKPIIGCEVYVARRGNLEWKSDKADLGG